MVGFAVAILLSSLPMMSQGVQTSPCAAQSSEIVASHVAGEIKLDAAHPAAEWQKAQPVVFCSDWQGKNPDEQRETQVRVLWSSQTLYLRFECRYRDLYVFDDSDPNGRRDHLWDRDVAEAFLQPDPSRERNYREFEVSPNGMWIDLDIFPGRIGGSEERFEKVRGAGCRRASLDCGDGHPIESAYARLRPKSGLAGEFLSGRRERRATNLYGVAANRNSTAEFPRSCRFWKAAFLAAGR